MYAQDQVLFCCGKFHRRFDFADGEQYEIFNYYRFCNKS